MSYPVLTVDDHRRLDPISQAIVRAWALSHGIRHPFRMEADARNRAVWVFHYGDLAELNPDTGNIRVFAKCISLPPEAIS